MRGLFFAISCLAMLFMSLAYGANNTDNKNAICTLKIVNMSDEKIFEIKDHQPIPVRSSITLSNQNCEKLKLKASNTTMTSSSGQIVTYEFNQDNKTLTMTISGKTTKPQTCGGCGGNREQFASCDINDDCWCNSCQ